MVEIIDTIDSERVELIKSREEEKLKKRWFLDSYWWKIIITHIVDDVFSVEWISWNITYYINWSNDVLVTLWNIWESPLFKQWLLLSWFIETKDDKWVYHLYRIREINWKDYPSWILSLIWWDLSKISITKWEEVDKYSEEYYNAWVDISFYVWYIAIGSLKRPPLKWDKLVMVWNDFLDACISDKVLRIKDLLFFKERWDIDKDIYDKLLPKVVNLLLWQIWDKRFDMVWDPVTKEELDWYFKEWYITKEYYLQCIELMVELWKVDKKILDELKQQIKPELDWLMREVK